ncbi:4496_t:CDS:2, partial [Cetraspora pellucida]
KLKMNFLNSKDFTMAAQMYKNNNHFDTSSNISLDDSNDSDGSDGSYGTFDIDDSESTCEKLMRKPCFQAPSVKDINHTIDYSKVANTKHNTQTWVNTINEYFTDLNHLGDITQVKSRTELENILIQFFVALKRKDGQPYAPMSIHNCYCGIARHLLTNSCQDPKPNIFDKNQFSHLYATIDGKINKSDSLTNNEIIQILNHEDLLQDTSTAITYRVYFWLCLLCGLHGGDAKQLQYDHVKENDSNGLTVTIPREKNYAGGLKNLNNSGRRGKHFTSKEFFLKIAYKKDFEKDIWFYDSPLGRYAHEKMIRNICQTTGVVNMNLKKITNHSLRRTAIQMLTQLNVNTDRIMAFSGHCSLGGVASYQTFTKKIMNNTVAMIVPDSQESTSNSSHPPLAPISNSNNQVVRQHSKIFKPRPFKPYDASKPFVSPLKKPVTKIVEEDTQEILPAVDSNSTQEMPRIIVENCSNCQIEIKITMK